MLTVVMNKRDFPEKNTGVIKTLMYSRWKGPGGAIPGHACPA